jgi:hypothetical protein
MSRPIRLFALAAALTGLIAVAGCGENLRQGQVVASTDEGLYLTSNGLKYQVQISRFLNPSDAEDSSYLKGLPSGEQLGRNEIWFGVFMRVENDGGSTEPATSDFTITDTQNNTFRPVPLDTNVNSFAYRPQTLPPTGLIPNPNSVAGQGSIQGSLILFRLNEDDLQNRPLTLHIGQGSQQRSVELDL